jgi:hypothetical protein
MKQPFDEILARVADAGGDGETPMLRTSLAAFAIVIAAGTGFAYAADDSKNENTAIESEQGKLPSSPSAAGSSAVVTPQTPPAHDQELKELKQEKTDHN